VLLGAIQGVCTGLFVAALRVGLPAGKDNFAFMAAEVTTKKTHRNITPNTDSNMSKRYIISE
jgi:hypothetical protein